MASLCQKARSIRVNSRLGQYSLAASRSSGTTCQQRRSTYTSTSHIPSTSLPPPPPPPPFTPGQRFAAVAGSQISRPALSTREQTHARHFPITATTATTRSAPSSGTKTVATTRRWSPPAADDVAKRPIVVLGAGHVGRRLATIWASASRRVILHDESRAALDSALMYVADHLGDACLRKGSLPGRVTSTTVLEDAMRATQHEAGKSGHGDGGGCGGPWLVLECLPERQELKEAVLGRVDALVPHDCILATSSSGFAAREIAGGVVQCDRLVNLHHQNPRASHSYVELMGCAAVPNTGTSTSTTVTCPSSICWHSDTHRPNDDATSDISAAAPAAHPALLPFLAEQLTAIGLRPITVPAAMLEPDQLDGHHRLVAERLWASLRRETLRILAGGSCSPQHVDALFRDFFRAEKGPCERMDELGLDVVLHAERGSRAASSSAGSLDWLEHEYVRAGKLGGKGGEGEGLFTSAERKSLQAARLRSRWLQQKMADDDDD